MRTLEYVVATSIDGFIAQEDGDFSPLLAEGDSLQALFEELPETMPAQVREAVGIDAPNRRFSAVLMGAGTYEVPGGLPSPYPHLDQYVVSTRPLDVPSDVHLVTGDVLGAITALKAGDGQPIWLCGGGRLAATLLPEIDRLLLKVTPVVLGRGRPLVAGGVQGFRPTGVRRFDNGVTWLDYEQIGPVSGGATGPG